MANVVDVDLATIRLIWSMRPDIAALYCANLRPDGRPWCDDPHNVTDTEKIAIITDWWTRVAGYDDAPALFRGSLAQWVRQRLHITPNTTAPVQQPSGPWQTPGGIPALGTGGTLLAVALIMAMFFTGGKQKQHMRFVTPGEEVLASLRSRGRR